MHSHFELSGLRDAISFFSIFPVGKDVDISNTIIYYFTISGLVISAMPALLFYSFSMVMNSLSASAISLSALLLISGFTHLDGVLDSGDALMARGTMEHRIQVLKDRYTGAGAIGTVLVVYITYFAVLSGFSPYYGLAAVIIGEITSKFSYSLSIGLFPPIGEGLAKRFSEIYRSAVASPILINTIPLVAVCLILAPSALIGVIVSLMVYSVLSIHLKRIFDGLNGDLMALLGEVSRVIFLISFAIILSIPLFRLTIV